MSNNQMIINYVPGDECRVAIVEDGKLEELHAERFASASRVGNIYVGKVTNVEASIQAAFIDFGVGENGFLHYSDLHPRYFPGEDVEETTERVGHKTPRRERPPIQHCLKRGQEITVQVLKEGVGTKGPTLTSYLSIPGRYLVMMPQMDKVGVSRKVEDEEQRAKMRQILDQLDLPEGFGFILRTAGMDRTKLELKRDLAYLQRLWKDMERRRDSGSKPRLLYSESDLLVRALRDLLTGETNEVVIDHEVALERASRFMKIVSPRSTTKLLHYPGKTPIFHAFGVEPQIALIHAREVPLPSGGRLVIDQTEALVAIDVNSGKSRESRDAEENAYRTNLEAVDEICRQLRLRDLGGIVVNDLIDMRSLAKRREIETRFKERLKRDKARTTTANISPFGILEMTRQRMRGSHESVHFVDCPTCRGRGLVQRPDSVASDALRELAAVLDIDRVSKVEIAVAPRVAGELLSSRRQLLGRIERSSGKHVDVRVSESVPVDRVSFYAYDAAGADIDLAAVQHHKKPKDLKAWQMHDGSEWADEIPTGIEPDAEEVVEPGEPTHPIEMDLPDVPVEEGDDRPVLAGDDDQQDRGGRKRRRRRGGRGRGRAGESEQPRDQGRDPRRDQRDQRDQRRDGRDRTASPGDDAGPIDAPRPARLPRPDEEPRVIAGVAPTRVRPVPAAGDYDDESTASHAIIDAGSPDSSGDSSIDTPTDHQAQGGPGPDGQTGEGGRRRRRRRRGGRGRNRNRQGDQGAINPDGIADQRDESTDDRAESRPDSHDAVRGIQHTEGPDAGMDSAGDSPADTDDGRDAGDDSQAPDAQTSEQQGDQPGDQPGEGGKRRRRRRRRGGRGRGGENRPDGQPAVSDGERNQSRSQPDSDIRRQGGHRDGHRDGRRDGQRQPRESREPRAQQPRETPAAQPPSPPAPEPQPTPAAQPRRLYGFKRKLSPSELNKRPKPE
ncbi:MAG: Rne/Rng family ribonuclease [Phycisphaerales bacterium]|nr:Rne/Rng family ribonuclease [Phycisphaerales bacterium]